MEKLTIGPWSVKALGIMKLSSIYVCAFTHRVKRRLRFDVRCWIKIKREHFITQMKLYIVL